MSPRGPGWWLAVVASAAMLVVAASGLWYLGTPAHQRALRLDARRVQDLRMLTNHIAVYWRSHKALPADLELLNANPVLLRDPQTDEPYEYVVTSKTAYRLCAHFTAAWPSDDAQHEPLTTRPLLDDDSWRHTAGRTCFERSVKR